MKIKDVAVRGVIIVVAGIAVFFITNFLIDNINLSANDGNIIDVLSVILGVLASIAVFLFMRVRNIKNSDNKIMYQMAYVDKITGAYNKDKFVMEAAKIVSEKKDRYAAVVIEINNFDIINEMFGFDEEERFLKHIAEVIKNNIADDEIFARENAGRFLMLVKFFDNNDIKKRLKIVMDEISEYKAADKINSKYLPSSCCGIYIIEDSDIVENNEEIEFGVGHALSRAKFALSEIIGKNVNSCYFYDEEIRNQMFFENDMESALANKEFIVYIQPKYDIKSHTLTGGEALIRWNHHEKGFLSPDKFVPVFEKNGFIVELDMYVFETVCKMQKKWLEMGLDPVKISVNQSRLHLYNPNYVETLEGIIKKYDVPARLIELEITESVAFDNIELISDVLRRLHEIGFTISMDDFGSGYSSLNMLKNLDVDVLKIDKEFFEETANTKRGQDIIESIIGMASKLGIETVAEGVETIEQSEFLQGNGCDIAQGYFYAMPMSLDDYEGNELIKRAKSRNA